MKKTLFIAFLSLAIISCKTKREPTPQGELLTTEAIMDLPKDGSMNGKIISIDGFYGYCPTHFSPLNGLKLKSKVNFSIRTEADCNGDELISARIYLENEDSFGIGGDEPRNCIWGKKGTFDPNEAKITTDDYQEVTYQKLRFSGKLVFEKDNYYMTDVSIHTIK